jgi:hypothetical protein
MWPPPSAYMNYKHLAMPMICPITEKSISSYKRIINDPPTAEAWMAAFGKDFCNMSQGINKTGQKGTNAMLVLLPSNVPNIPKNCVVLYTWVVVDHCLQKQGPDCNQITTGGNLINYPGEPRTRMADITMAKLFYISMLGTLGAKFMCLGIKNCYLSAPLDRYKYMQILFTLLPCV